jgi:uncharacterized membrane protein YidH (DUF202 family)
VVVKIIGILLIVLGLGGLAYGGLSWTRKDKVVDLGPVQVTRDKTESVPIPPIAGAACLLAGAAMLVADSRGTRAA